MPENINFIQICHLPIVPKITDFINILEHKTVLHVRWLQ